ncbi:hypothetical protein FHX37_2635 [Haloactinospora alba]|uniref:Uncharacterized protein n=1 Tax=Haloactinospora alba TaxID=405555 RepID=A0A543NLE0_9ACTN|nr:hypothetical protein [Haloactinospora alba]TQN32658.1 hypothetical protein FHX37_2635 [Haloactinospora alba]
MFAGLTVDGEPVTVLDEDVSVRMEIDPDACATEYRCRACGEKLSETPRGFETDRWGACCPEFEPTDDSDPDFANGTHDPQRIALSWCNGAGITTDTEQDSVTVTLSVGDPRGAFALTIRRVPADADSELAGRLVMHVPYTGEPMSHMETTALHPGTYLLGPPPAVLRHTDAA